MTECKLYATLIGIDAYRQNPLSGCIKDVLDIDLLLRNQCAQQPGGKIKYEPLYLLAPSKTDLLRIEEYEKLVQQPLIKEEPTFDNVSKKAFDHFKKAKDGDICVLFYSGHGSQTEAPEVFWHNKPDRMNETIVCVDSRDPSNAEARDIIDKELAYLVWDALSEKKVHCLVIMDCCHSGNNMRNIDASSVQYRFVPSSRNKIPLEKYIGYAKGDFYQVKDNKASIKIARYVQLSACRDAEKAQESAGGGLFTTKLVEMLRSGGTGQSYRDLAETLTISVRNRAEQQNPVAFSREDDDLDLQFLGGNLLPYRPFFTVNFDHKQEKWLIYGGAMHGLTVSSLHAKTAVRISYEAGGKQKEADIEIIEVYPGLSVLDPKTAAVLDKDKTYQAILSSLGNPPIKIGLSKGLLATAAMVDELKAAYTKEPHLFFQIDFDDPSNAEYLIQADVENNFLFTRAKSDVPLFKREDNAESFLRNIDSVGKWISASELKNISDKFTAGDFVFTFEKIEGIDFSKAPLKDAKGTESIIQPGDEITLSYKGKLQPAFALSIALNKKSKIESCYIGALYLESKFGIVHNLIQEDASRLVRDTGVPAKLVFVDGDVTYDRLPVSIDPAYELYGINEITEFLKIIVSDKPIKLERFKQKGLRLDTKPNVQMRELGLEHLRANDNLGDETAWAVFTNKLRTIKDSKEKDLVPGGEADFVSFKVTVPESIKAKAIAITGDDIQAKLKSTALRSIDEEEQIPSSLIKPPPSLFGDAVTADIPFAKGLNSSSDNGIQVLELVPAAGEETLVLPEGQSLIITPRQQPKERSASDFEEMVIPYGFDESSQLYFPLGYSDEEGNIYINKLPSETPGRLSGDQVLTRSLGGSIKLFFKKIFRYRNQDSLNRLVLYRLNDQHQWEKTNLSPGEMKEELAKKPGSKVILLIHGIIGDTKAMYQLFSSIESLKAEASYLMTYDYENLATPVKATSKKLLKDLTDAGLDNKEMPRLVVVAHSMGGLVMRWLIEREKKPLQLKALVLVGTPSGGSEIASFGSSLFNLLTHAINVTGPLKYFITGISFLIKKLQLDPKKTLDDLNIEAEFITELNEGANKPDDITYNMVCGDTSLIAEYNGDDVFLKKIAAVLKRKIVYPGLKLFLYKDKPNDIAVTIESMKTIPAFEESQVHLVASDHISYFDQGPTAEVLSSLVK